MARYVGIHHRVKQTANQEAHPTKVVIVEGINTDAYNLDTETDELDWLLGRHPVAYRKYVDGADLQQDFLEHHIARDKKTDKPTRVPAEFDGFKPGDTVAMTLGGSGGPFAFALSRRGEEIGARVMRITPADLKEMRVGDKSNDAALLAHLIQSRPDLFCETGPRDRDLIMLRECLTARTDAMKARIGCEQRLRQHVIGMAFCNPEGRYPEGSVEKEFEGRKANDVIFNALVEEEEERMRDLTRAVEALEVYRRLFEPIKGVGPRIAAGIIAGIADVRRFPTDAKLKAFCGVHVLPDGRMARRRGGEVANWNAEVRQSLYLLGDQFNYNPDSRWGQLLREYKAKLRVTHPEPVIENGKSRYSNGHIHRMAIWKTLSKFVEWLWREWWKIEEEHRQESADERTEAEAAG